MTAPWRVLKLTPPDGKNPFFVAIIAGKPLLSTRTDGRVGRSTDVWTPEAVLSVADVLRPEYELGNWDVEVVEASTAPELGVWTKDDEEHVLTVEELPK